MATPRQLLAQYTTQATATTYSYPTVQNLLDDIDARLPNNTTTLPKLNWMNDEIGKIWKYMASTKTYSFQTGSSQAFYAMSTDMRFDTIKSVQVSDSTLDTSTALYTEYKLAGADAELSGSQYFDGLGSIGLYPVPTSAGHFVKVIYENVPPRLTTSNTSTVPGVDPEHTDILKFRVLSNLAKSGSPDVEMANGYEADYKELFSRLKMSYYKKKAANPKDPVSHKDGWWQG